MRYVMSVLTIAFILITGCNSRPAFDWSKPRYVLYLTPQQMVPVPPPRVMPGANHGHQPSSSVQGIPQPRYLPSLPENQANSGRPQNVSEAVDSIIEAEQQQAQAENDQFRINAIETYDYEAGTVYDVVTSPGFVSTLELQVGETVVSIAGGDSANWMIDTIDGGATDPQNNAGPSDSVRTYVLIKPQRPFQRTNLIVTTDRRAYHLELASLETATYHTAVNWNYSQGNSLVIRRASEEKLSEILERARRKANPPSVNYGYNVRVQFGDIHPAWTPVRVYDDGRQVFIEFSPDSQHFSRPVLFAKQPDGSLSLINYRMEGDRCVSHGLFNEAELRLGTQIVRIERTYSRHYAPAPR